MSPVRHVAPIPAARTPLAAMLLAAAAVLLALPPGASAQNWPTRPVRIVVPFPPGGNTDALARITAERLSGPMGQQFVVENRAGAAGMIGSEGVAKSAPDGYTLLMGTASQIITAPFIQKLAWEPAKELAPISIIGSNSFVLTVPASLPVANLREFIDYARARPGQLNYGSGGNGTVTHLSAALFVQKAGLAMAHVPYKGGGPALADVMGGQIQLYSASPSEVIAQVAGGKVKLLGISSLKRNPRLPNVPPIADVISGHQAETWNGLMAPAKAPAAVIDRVSQEIQKAMGEPAFLERLEKTGVDPVRHTPQEFAEQIRREIAMWGEVIQKAGIKPE